MIDDAHIGPHLDDEAGAGSVVISLIYDHHRSSECCADGPAAHLQVSITVTVEPDQEGYDDPVWIADAAWGSLANEYDYECTFGDVTELPADRSATGPSDVAEP